LGLLLFLRQGMAAWVHTCRQSSMALPSAVQAPGACECRIDSHLRRELVDVLVAMVLGPRKVQRQ
jgi:hypothetical protein